MDKIKIKYKTKSISIRKFSKFNLGSKAIDSDVECVNFYNLRVKQGVLKKSLGVRSLMVYESNDVNSLHYQMDYECLNLEYINKVMYFKQYFASSGDTTHRLLIHGSDGKLYLYQMFSGLVNPNWVYELQFDDIPAVLSYKKDGLDSILISARDKLVVWSTGRTPYELTNNIPTITSMCVYNDVLYCTIAGESDKIWYTSNLDPESVGTESENTGYLTLEGSAGGGKKTIVLDEKVFVFCDYGIGRINTYAKNKPTYNQIYLSNGKIYPDTVAISGDVAIFLTDDGLYQFNGTSAIKIDILKELFVDSKNSNATATVLNDNYYLATNLRFIDDRLFTCEEYIDHVNNAVIKLNLNNNSFEIIRGVDVKSMLALKAGVEEKVVLTFNGKNKNLIGEFTYEKDGFFTDYNTGGYVTNYIADKYNKDITIRDILVEASEGETIIIYTEKGTFGFYTYCNGINEFKTIIPCKKFKIEMLLSNYNSYINSIDIKYITSNQ